MFDSVIGMFVCLTQYWYVCVFDLGWVQEEDSDGCVGVTQEGVAHAKEQVAV